MLTNGLKLSEDNPKLLMESSYNRQVLGIDLFQLVEQVEKIGKTDVMAIAQQVSLQAMYVMEGEEQ
jgi:predicted Zn-dependent peptidase